MKKSLFIFICMLICSSVYVTHANTWKCLLLNTSTTLDESVFQKTVYFSPTVEKPDNDVYLTI